MGQRVSPLWSHRHCVSVAFELEVLSGWHQGAGEGGCLCSLGSNGPSAPQAPFAHCGRPPSLRWNLGPAPSVLPWNKFASFRCGPEWVSVPAFPLRQPSVFMLFNWDLVSLEGEEMGCARSLRLLTRVSTNNTQCFLPSQQIIGNRFPSVWRCSPVIWGSTSPEQWSMPFSTIELYIPGPRGKSG